MRSLWKAGMRGSDDAKGRGLRAAGVSESFIPNLRECVSFGIPRDERLQQFSAAIKATHAHALQSAPA